MSGLVFAGAAALTAGAVTPASAEAISVAPHVVFGGGGGPAPRPQRVVRRMVVRAPARACCGVNRSSDFQRAHVNNRNFNFSRSDSQQAEHQRQHQFDFDRDFKFHHFNNK
ncbi:MAG: hypothetical protein ACRDT1_14280, partial [Micromonosporaceae bacterium]